MLVACVALSAQAQEPLRISLIDEDSAPTLYMYVPDQPCGKAVLACPGGAYQHLAIGHEGHDLAPWFLEQGIAYGVLEYRMPHGECEIPLTDVNLALDQMRSHSQEWGFDPRLIGIMGSSAGGHLAATASTQTDVDKRPAFTILLYPVICLNQPNIRENGTWHNLLGDNPSAELETKYSLDQQVDSLTPPAFIMVSADDPISPLNSVAYWTALKANGIPAALHIYESGSHGWGFNDSFPHKAQAYGELKHWLTNF